LSGRDDAVMSVPPPPVLTPVQRSSWTARIFSFPVVMGMALVAMLFAWANQAGHGASVADPDIWWHLRNAADLLHTRHFPHTAPWTFTVAGQPWMNGEWLAELPYSFAYRVVGDRGLFLVTMLVTCAIVLSVYALARMRCGSWRGAFLGAVVTAAFATVSLAPRTLLFGWLCLVAELAVLWNLEKGRDHTAWLPVIFLFWVNLHGSWFVGFVLMLVFFAGGWMEGAWGDLYARRWSPPQKRRLLVVAAAGFAALFVNPYGWRLVAYPLDVAYGQNLMIQSAAEWGSLDFHSLRGKVVLAVLLLLAALQLVRRCRWSVQDLAFALIAIYGAFAYVRFTYLAGILFAPVLAILVTRRPDPPPQKRRTLLNALAMGLLLFSIVLWCPTEQRLRAADAVEFPAKAIPAVRALAAHGNLFADVNWAGYLEWNVPEVREFADTRYDVFVHRGVMADYLRATTLHDTFAILDKYQIRCVLLPQNAPMAYLLAHSARWTTTYDDGQAVIFDRAR
jgi:hypothetical protein